MYLYCSPCIVNNAHIQSSTTNYIAQESESSITSWTFCLFRAAPKDDDDEAEDEEEEEEEAKEAEGFCELV